MKPTYSFPQQSPMNNFQIFIVRFHRRTWRNFARISAISFVLLFIGFLSFYFRIYVPSFKEQSFENLINCTAVNVKNYSRLCKRDTTGKICQLVHGFCSDGVNRTLYSTWKDNEESSAICTMDPCLTSTIDVYFLGQTFSPIYQSSLYEFGYMSRTAKLNFLPSRIIFYALIALLIFLIMTTVALLWILHNYQNYMQILSPVSISSVNPSFYRRPPSIVVQKASKTSQKEDLHWQASAPSSNATISSSNSLGVPIEMNGIVPMENLHQQLQPLDPTTLPSSTAIPLERKD